MRSLKHGVLAIRGEAPTDCAITAYDQAHALTYARIHDAVLRDADWRDGAREILALDPDADPAGAWLCWASHVERAKWMSTVGLELAFHEAGLIESH